MSTNIVQYNTVPLFEYITDTNYNYDSSAFYVLLAARPRQVDGNIAGLIYSMKMDYSKVYF